MLATYCLDETFPKIKKNNKIRVMPPNIVYSKMYLFVYFA